MFMPIEVESFVKEKLGYDYLFEFPFIKVLFNVKKAYIRYVWIKKFIDGGGVKCDRLANSPMTK